MVMKLKSKNYYFQIFLKIFSHFFNFLMTFKSKFFSWNHFLKLIEVSLNLVFYKRVKGAF